MEASRYRVVRVFARDGKNGNGLAVFPDARGMKAPEMQETARILGFSETSFVFPPTARGADYRVRFFTPRKELPFAGHPSIGTLFVLLEDGAVGKKRNYVQQIGRRLVKLRLEESGRITMDQGRPFFGKSLAAAAGAALLGLGKWKVAGNGIVASTGLPHILVPLKNLAALKSASLRPAVYRHVCPPLKAYAVMPFVARGGKLFSRMFAPALGVDEDPATGSGAGPLAAWAVKTGMVPPTGETTEIEIRQGRDASASSLLFVRVTRKGGDICGVEVGGFTMADETRPTAT